MSIALSDRNVVDFIARNIGIPMDFQQPKFRLAGSDVSKHLDGFSP